MHRNDHYGIIHHCRKKGKLEMILISTFGEILKEKSFAENFKYREMLIIKCQGKKSKLWHDLNCNDMSKKKLNVKL